MEKRAQTGGLTWTLNYHISILNKDYQMQSIVHYVRTEYNAFVKYSDHFTLSKLYVVDLC